MDDELKEKRERTLTALREALAELERGEGCGTFMEGHGLQSRRFHFEWREPSLEIDFRLPWGRVLSDEEQQQLDDVRIGAACRMAILLLSAAGEGSLLAEGEARLSVSAEESGERYAIFGPDGAVMDSAGDWGTLVARLAAAFPEESDGAPQIFWP